MKNNYIFLIFFLLLSASPGLLAQCTFSVSSDSLCATQTVSFTIDNPDGASNYEWDFENDGQIDATGTETDHVFPLAFQDSLYTVVLLENGDSCTSSPVLVQAVPDPSVGVPPGSTILVGTEIKACSGDANLTLELFNASQTFSDNVSYDINWGDNTPVETFDNSTFSQTNTISHTYPSFGYFTLFVTATHSNGCVFTNTYTLYNGGNPSVGLVIPGNTVGLCAPATLEFPITNTANNPPGTEYTIFVNGEIVATYNQDSLPPSFIYTFENGSCGVNTSTGNYENAFDVRIVASNPCNSSTATIEPIEISEPPDVDFVMDLTSSCVGSEVTFNDATVNINEVVSGNPSECVDVLLPSWEIIGGTAGVDWEVISGNIFNSEELVILFQTPGVYTIEMTVVSFACGPITVSQTLTVVEPPILDASLTLDTLGNGGCAPLTVPLINNSAGEDISYSWTVDPPDGWYFDNGADSTSAEPQIVFAEGGQYTIQLAVSNPCETMVWDTTIIVAGPPLIAADPLADACLTETLDFSPGTLTYNDNSNPITSYQWEFPGGVPATSTDPFPTGIQYDNPGIYAVSLVVANGCGERTWVDTFEVQIPETLSMPPGFSVCGNAPSTQLTATPSGGTWSGPGVTSTGEFDAAQAPIGLQTLQYSYGTGACFLEGQLEISVLPPPNVVLPPPLTLCNTDAPLTLTPEPAGGNWTDNASILQNDVLDPESAGAGTYELIYTFTDTTGCSDLDTLSVWINASPVPVAGDSTYCAVAGSVYLPAAQPASGSWSGPGVLHPAGIFDPMEAGGPGTYQLVYSVTDSVGCTGITTTEVELTAPPIVEAGPHQAACADEDPLNLNAAVFPPGGTWQTNSEGLSGTYFDPVVAGPGSHWLFYTVDDGICAVYDSVRIEVVDLTLTSAGPNQNVCIDAGLLAMSGNDPSGGTWSGPGIIDPQQGLFDPAETGIGQFQVFYDYTDPLTGCSISVPKTIGVKPKPETNFTVPPLGCVNEAVQFINQTSDGLYFSWNFGDGSQSGSENPTHVYTVPGMYEVSLQVLNSFGCQRDTTLPVLISEPPVAGFAPDQAASCAGTEIAFTNNSMGDSIEYLWDFGNGEFSVQEQPQDSVAFQQGFNDTTYTVTLTATNICGSDSWEEIITIHPLPVSDFGFTVDTGCSPLQLAINNISLGSPESYYWDLGNGNTSTDSLPPLQTYVTDTVATNYTVTLITENSCGSDTLNQVVTVLPEEVTAFFNVNVTEGCAPLSIQFTDYTALGTLVSWDFGNGNQSNAVDPLHTFAEAGTYTVTQYASNTCGADSTTLDIEVYPQPDLAFSWEDPPCENEAVQFVNLSPGLAAAHWDFGTGSTSDATAPTYQFPGPGSYQITLIGTAQLSGCQDTTIQIIQINEAPEAMATPDQLSGCAPLYSTFQNVSTGADFYQWNFGDGNTSVQQQPEHTFLASGNYQVTLTVSNLAGCTDDTTLTPVQVFPVPEASFTTERDTLCGLPAEVSFSNTSTGAQGFVWDFGNGSQSGLTEPTTTYGEAGTYTVRLIVFNQYGCTDTVPQSLVVYPQPLADFTFTDSVYCSPTEIHFTNYSVGNQFLWEFGDGQVSEADNPVHVYETGGTFEVTLIASFDGVCADTLPGPVPVAVLSSPLAYFTWTDGENGVIQFHNESELADYYTWDFGDGNGSEETHPTHRFTQNSVWMILLEAISENGCRDEYAIQLEPTFFGSMFVPNALMPEQGDPEVATFLPKAVGLVEYRLQIFSTYGELLWQSTELEDGRPAVGWNGTYKGKLLPQDVYVWKIYGLFEDGTEWRGQLQPNGTYKRIGSVTLIR